MEFQKAVILFDQLLAWKKGLKSKKHFSLWTKIMTAVLLLPKWKNCLQLCISRRDIIRHLGRDHLFSFQGTTVRWKFRSFTFLSSTNQSYTSRIGTKDIWKKLLSTAILADKNLENLKSEKKNADYLNHDLLQLKLIVAARNKVSV